MSAQSKLQWVSCLALALLAASCSGMAGSPIQEDNLDAAAGDGPMPQASDEREADSIGSFFDIFTLEDGKGFSGGMPAPLGSLSQANKSASYTPGLPCVIPIGFSMPNIFEYGWMGGAVSESAAGVQLTAAPGTPPIAYTIYAFKEMDFGRLQTVIVHGSGKSLAVVMFNWNTFTWEYFGTHDLSMATPAVIPVDDRHAPNGVTYFALIQLSPGQTLVDGIDTDVF